MHYNKSLSHQELLRAGVLSMLAFALVIVGTSEAFAQTVQLCNGINLLKSDIGKGVSTLGVIGIAIGATFGKVSWGMAVMVAVGIAAMHSAGTIAGYFGGTGCTLT